MNKLLWISIGSASSVECGRGLLDFPLVHHLLHVGGREVETSQIQLAGILLRLDVEGTQNAKR
ncbi:hypothetical protein AB0N24_20680 [Arthrobacter sp. NPDC093128]|uniref:hypothetical protein n=1 Tax=Arthrobacter sp. NPDC093128 TaxID=3154979 RepID=UPI00342D156A